jgi:hypothetical protein
MQLRLATVTRAGVDAAEAMIVDVCSMEGGVFGSSNSSDGG